MADLPTHPDAGDADIPQPSRRLSRPVLAGIVLAALAMVAMVALHLTGVVGPGAH
ncbi:hypothetical protein [Streptomyces sp. NPDC058424]|uniref:hypothetical protein n=1 Tax=Streptomyces sp. NPDC058424 TaxID=3346491 RepID=UPI00366480B0